ncbi:MAG TPA: ABC transporter permease, partial [bacterium]
MNLNILPIVRKEFLHIRRDARSLIIIILMPILQLMIFTYAINLDLENIRLGVLDESRTPASRDLVRLFTGSDYFIEAASLNSRKGIEELFKKSTIHAALIIPPDFDAALQREPRTEVQIIVDGSDSNVGSIIVN